MEMRIKFRLVNIFQDGAMIVLVTALLQTCEVLLKITKQKMVGNICLGKLCTGRRSNQAASLGELTQFWIPVDVIQRVPVAQKAMSLQSIGRYTATRQEPDNASDYVVERLRLLRSEIRKRDEILF